MKGSVAGRPSLGYRLRSQAMTKSASRTTLVSRPINEFGILKVDAGVNLRRQRYLLCRTLRLFFKSYRTKAPFVFPKTRFSFCASASPTPTFIRKNSRQTSLTSFIFHWLHLAHYESPFGLTCCSSQSTVV